MKRIVEKEVIELYNENKPIRELSRKFNISRTSIKRILRNNNIKIRNSRNALILMGRIKIKKDIKNMFSYYKKNRTLLKDIAKKFNMHPNTIGRLLAKEYGEAYKQIAKHNSYKQLLEYNTNKNLTIDDKIELDNLFLEYKNNRDVHLKDLAKSTNLEQSTIGKYYKKRFGKEYRSVSKNKLKKIIFIDSIKEDENLAQIIAALLSDGSVERGLLIKFVNKDIVLINKFLELSKAVFSLSDKNIKGNFMFKNDEDIKDIYICSVDLVSSLHKYTPTYRTKPYRDINKNLIKYPNSYIPQFIMNGNKEIKHAFLRMYASCDGCVEIHINYVNADSRYDIRGRVSFICQHPVINQQLFDLLTSLSFSPVKKNGLVQLNRTKDINLFAKHIGFINGCRITNSNKRVYFYYKKKEDVLGLLVYLLYNGIPKELSYCYKSDLNKKKVIKYISKILDYIKNKQVFEQTSYKANNNFNLITPEEKEWLIKRKEFNSENNIPYTTITNLFFRKFNKRISPQIVYYYRKGINGKSISKYKRLPSKPL